MPQAEAALTDPELRVYNWLTNFKIPFQPQVNFYGGASQAGGARVDYLLTELYIIIRVQSYWHTIDVARARDVLQKIQLLNDGYKVVDVYEDDIKTNIDNVMYKAIRGEELHG